MLTVRLNNGVVVLGKLYKGEPCALSYVNRTQAKRKAEQVDGTVYHREGPCFYVAPPTPVILLPEEG